MPTEKVRRSGPPLWRKSGAVIAKYRKIAGWKQNDVAEATKISSLMMSLYEQGKSHPRGIWLSRFAIATGIDKGAFFGEYAEAAQHEPR